MKKLLVFVFCLSSQLCIGSIGENLIKMTDKLLMELKSDTLEVDTTVFTSKYYGIMKQYDCKVISDWELSYEDMSDTVKVVKVKYDRRSGYSGEVYSVMAFSFLMHGDEWKIFNSYRFLEIRELSLRVEGQELKDLWDLNKLKVIKDVKDNLKLELFEDPVPFGIDKNSITGKLKLSNNTEYDISRIMILIEHFDKEGKSCSTTKKYLSEVIRSGGYKIFDWSTFDCYNCHSRKYSIDF